MNNIHAEGSLAAGRMTFYREAMEDLGLYKKMANTVAGNVEMSAEEHNELCKQIAKPGIGSRT